jgi:hypothetical protein
VFDSSGHGQDQLSARPRRNLRKPRLLAVCIGCNPCRPQDTHVHVGSTTIRCTWASSPVMEGVSNHASGSTRR